MLLNDLCSFLPEDLARALTGCENTLTEIRIRAEKPVQLVCMNSSRFIELSYSVQEIRRLALRMMDHSYYAREHELSQGFFTMTNGYRVGVGGNFVSSPDGGRILRCISSLCIRIARAVPDCAAPLVELMISEDRLRSTLIISRPGMGKTTLLRDASRLLSGMGYAVGIADERYEIAACRNGIPTMEVGICTDVVDGCPKAQAMEHLIRSMSPRIIVTDEIGNRRDLEAIQDAARRGIVLLASAHSDSFEHFEAGSMGFLLKEGLFELAVLLGKTPGNIESFRYYHSGGSECSRFS